MAGLSAEVQEIADKRFGERNIIVRVSEIRSGSIEIFIVVATVGKAAIDFFSNYKKIKIGVNDFADDVRKQSKLLFAKLNALIRRGSGKKKAPRKRG